MFEKAQGEHVSFSDDGAVVKYTGRHTGYSRLPDSVTHERSFRLDRASSRLEIRDRLAGSGRHRLSWHFHLAPGVNARLAFGACTLTAANQSVELSLPKDLAAAVSDAWYSPSYGVRVPCQALDLTTDVEVGAASEWSFTFMPKESA
jgi:uncharacterized heparinase superfamily protein